MTAYKLHCKLQKIKHELTNALVLQHFQKFLYAFIPSLKCLFLRFYSKFQFLQQLRTA